MTNKRLDRIERILERAARSQQEMAARRQHRDEAFEQHDAQMKVIRETIAANAESIRRLEQLERGRRPNSSA